MDQITVGWLIEYLSKLDPEAVIFIETENDHLPALTITEDNTGITISSEY